MKLLAVALYSHRGPDAEPVCLGLAAELSSFGYFQRSSVKEMLSFLSKTIVQRTQPGQRQTVKQEDYFCHVHVKDGGIAGVAVTDRDYPTVAAFSVVGKAIEEFLAAAPPGEPWRGAAGEAPEALSVAEGALARYQDPVAADKLTKIQKDLDETKVILHQTIDSVLKRGEKLDTLVDKSADLSLASQMFYKQARKTNACCKMM
ncbi:YKT61 [Scenedesmus sp. PABB004]|nr:YKT61 [Scenedesmus sp. PABB004]